MRHAPFVVTAMAALLAACATSPPYQTPKVEAPATFRGGESAATEKSLGDLGWWEIYSDPQLGVLLRRTLERNRDLKIAAARIAETRSNLGVADYGPLPQVSASAGISRSRVSTVGSTPLPPGTGPDRRNYRATIDASYEVDFWGRIAALTDAARADLFAAEAARGVITTTLVGDVATAYFDLLSLDQQLLITERTLESRQRFLDLTQTRLRLGAATRIDVDRANANLIAARATVPDFKRRIEQTENLLRALAGDYPGMIERARATVEALPMPPDVPPGLPSKLLERRPDIQQAEQTLAGANARLASQRAALFPSFTLTAQLGSDSGFLRNFLTSPATIWSIAPNILMPILNAQRNRYLVDAAAAREVQAIEQYQKTVEQSMREVSDALAGRREFADARAAFFEQVVALREVNRVATRRYEAGIASYFEVIDAQRELLVAELALAQAQRNLLVSSVQLYKALGGGWQTEKLATR